MNELKAFFKAFTYAAEGIVHCLKHCRNFRFHLCAAVTVTVLSLYYDFSRTEYCILFLCIGSVISAELMNSAAEAAVDEAAGGKITANAKKAKDCAAGAVLVSAVFSAVCGFFLFGQPHILLSAASDIINSPFKLTAAILWFAFYIWFVLFLKIKPKD